MAFILVQHLDPTHESMMVDLLAGHTPMIGASGNQWHGDRARASLCHSARHYLSVGNGILHLSPPQARHGARLPFDFLLHSLAAGSRCRPPSAWFFRDRVPTAVSD